MNRCESISFYHLQFQMHFFRLKCRFKSSITWNARSQVSWWSQVWSNNSCDNKLASRTSKPKSPCSSNQSDICCTHIRVRCVFITKIYTSFSFEQLSKAFTSDCSAHNKTLWIVIKCSGLLWVAMIRYEPFHGENVFWWNISIFLYSFGPLLCDQFLQIVSKRKEIKTERKRCTSKPPSVNLGAESLSSWATGSRRQGPGWRSTRAR